MAYGRRRPPVQESGEGRSRHGWAGLLSHPGAAWPGPLLPLWFRESSCERHSWDRVFAHVLATSRAERFAKCYSSSGLKWPGNLRGRNSVPLCGCLVGVCPQGPSAAVRAPRPLLGLVGNVRLLLVWFEHLGFFNCGKIRPTPTAVAP